MVDLPGFNFEFALVHVDFAAQVNDGIIFAAVKEDLLAVRVVGVSFSEHDGADFFIVEGVFEREKNVTFSFGEFGDDAASFASSRLGHSRL